MIRNAKPVWMDTTGVNQYIEAKQSFCIEGNAKANLQICVDTEYAVYLNGEFVGSGQYRTSRGIKAYDEYDVTELVRKGTNEIVLTAYCEGENSQTYQQDTPMLAFALSCGGQIVLSGEDTKVRVHPFYESGRIEKVTPQLGYTYHYNGNGKETPWHPATLVPASFRYIRRPVKKLVSGELLKGRIYTQGIVKREGSGTPAEMMQTDSLAFRKKEEIFDGDTVKQRNDGAFFVIDLGGEYAGLLSMKIEAAEGTILDIGWGEHLEDMRVRTSVGGRNFACRYVCREGHQEFTGYFRRLGGRFLSVHITNMTGDVKFREIGLIPTDYPLSRKGYFTGNDFFYNRLCRLAANTLKLCMHEHYEDCPWREQALYAFDSYIQMLCGYYLFGEYEFARASLKLLADSQKEDGMLRICAPSGIPMVIPSFALTWIVSLEKYVLYSGDVEFGREMLPVAERVLGAFRIEDDLVQNDPKKENWHFYEWVPGLAGEGEPGEDSPSSFYYILACEAFQKICSYTGEKRECADIDRMRAAVKKKYFDEEKGLFRTREGDDRCHELTQALAVVSGVTEDTKILDKLLLKDNGMEKITLSASLFKYEALLSAGETYQDAVLEEIADIWGKMVYSGTDTLWEVAEGAPAFDNAGSLCHGWSAVPVYLLYKYYLGFEPTAPGFREYKLQPSHTEYITKIKTVLYTPEWTKQVTVTDGKIEELSSEK